MSYAVKRWLFISSIVLLFIFSATFLFMPISNVVAFEYHKLTNRILGIVFWMTGVLGYTSLILLFISETKTKIKKRRIIFTNILTVFSDFIFVISMISLVLLVQLKLTIHYIVYINIFIVIWSFNMHWLFSRNFHSKLLNKSKEKESSENREE